MTLLLREDDVRRLFPMSEAISVVRSAFGQQRSSGAENVPRRRLKLEHGVLNVMAASVPSQGSAGLKAYATGQKGARFLVALWDRDEGELLSLMEADWLGRIRTGAASGVATDLLANPEARIMALIGAGRQAQTQLEAVACIRRLREVRVYSRSRESREHFVAEVGALLGLPLKAVDSAEIAVDGADIVTTITGSAEPVVRGGWLTAGTHVNAAGSNQAGRREIDSEVLTRAAVIAVDSVEQARLEAGDLIIGMDERNLSWDRVTQLGDVLAGNSDGRSNPQDITVFESLGIAVEDVAAARYVYDRALTERCGEETSFGAGPP